MKEVPELRFQSDGLNNTTQWSEVKLGQIVRYRTEKGVIDNKNYVSTENMISNFGGIKFVDNYSGNTATKVYPGDILISNIRPYLKKIDIMNVEGGCSSDVLCLDVHSAIPEFLVQKLKTEDFINHMMMSAKGTKMPRGDKKTILKYKLRVPDEQEQQKIADFFSVLDSRIEIQEEKINNLENQKKGYMQRIFSQEIRFKDENGEDYPEWEEKRLGDMLSYERPDKYIVESTEYSSDKTKVPVLTANKAFILGYTDEEKGIYSKGEVIVFDDFTMDFKYANFQFKVKSSAIKLLTQLNKAEPLTYYAGLLESLNLKAFNHQRHWISIVQEMYVLVPSLLEQHKISNFLSLFDEKIEIEKKILETLQEMKRGFLQKMFV